MAETWVNTPGDAPTDAPPDTPADTPADAPPDTSADTPADASPDTPPGTSPGTDFHLELSGEGSLRAQLMHALQEAIRSGRLAPGTRLPPYRSLAGDLGIARNTVAAAYAELVEEGWLTARQGSGTRVARRTAPLHPDQERRPQRQMRRRLVHDLMPSSPDAAAFPRAAWVTSVRSAVAAAPNDAFGVGDPRGRVELRETLAEYLARARGVRTEPDRIVVCSGFAHALELLGGVLKGTVAVESYGLDFHRGILHEAGLRTAPLTVDSYGARIDELPGTGAGTVLLTPAHQFPTGGPLHPDRRTAVVDWARSHGGVLVEDDYDGEFRYDRQPVGAVQGLDPDRVVYIGSTSKSLSPALRLGWMVLPGWLVDDVLAVKGPREMWSGVLDQLTLADFIARGAYDRHLRQMRLHYRRRRDQLAHMIAERAPHIKVSGVAAGLHAVLELPDNTEELALHAARRQGLALDGLHAYRHPDSTVPPRDGLVIGYGTPPDHAFAAALDALCLALPDPPQDESVPRRARGRRAGRPPE
ncbi:PLP-dependent aminotransferase family protein [Streptomyces sp. DvalAA-19]|uniref:MocR-like pyridoxine biosynthesis transcription factor PdxR n=1 Tax=Streptomyces sp. DvalAA-19 TaxID=1839761 RepID=UPI00081B2BF6|nr:PLP-dependent aminotransferase family protein [Streptomyces sp. DvalAA-19]SCD74415.1 GntR family transcriptional regulator / MocR family aminotransferase [Streptomyces sp. DvalAA-19]